MRALKFRAWDNKEHKYLFPYPDAFWIIGETTVFLGEIEVIGNKYEGKTKVYEDSTNR